jgi:hypothetical protein
VARIRTIKPGFWTDSKVVALSPFARLMFIGMWNFAGCDIGHLSDDAAAIKRQVLPDDDVNAEALLAELVESGMVARVQTLSGRRYLHVVHLGDHQKTDIRWSPRCNVCAETRPNSPTLPETPAQHDETRASVTQTPPSSPQERKGKERNKTSSTATRSTDDDPDFTRFWDVYPRKVGKGEARKVWARLIKAGVNPTEVLAGVERYRDDTVRRRLSLEYIKHPGPWLNAERWTDQPAAPSLEDRGGDGEYVVPQAPREVVFAEDPNALPRWHAEQRALWEAGRSS